MSVEHSPIFDFSKKLTGGVGSNVGLAGVGNGNSARPRLAAGEPQAIL